MCQNAFFYEFLINLIETLISLHLTLQLVAETSQVELDVVTFYPDIKLWVIQIIRDTSLANFRPPPTRDIW